MDIFEDIFVTLLFDGICRRIIVIVMFAVSLAAFVSEMSWNASEKYIWK